jgi:arylsulfatase A-like enzyme
MSVSTRMRHRMSDDSPRGAGGGSADTRALAGGRRGALTPGLATVAATASAGFIAGSIESLAIASSRSFFFHSAADAAAFLLVPSSVYALIGALVGAVAAAAVRFILARRAAAALRSRPALWWGVASASLAACAFLAAWSALGVPSEDHPRTENTSGRNVLLITIDTLRSDALGCYTHRAPGESGSPVIDALASEGLVFENAIVPMIATGPSHASILTSLYPAEHGIVRNAYRLNDDVPTLAEAFRDLGYRTCGAVSVEHLDGYMSGLSRGFTAYIDRGVHDRFRHHLAWRAVPIRWIIEHERDAHATTDALVSWLRGSGDAPFFAWIHYFDPHMPYLSHDGTGGAFGWDDREFLPAASGEELAGLLADGVAGYGSEVSHVDAAIALLMTELRRLDLLGETLIVITSDHGEHMHEDRLPVEQWFGHYAIFEEACRVPLIIWKPGLVEPGRVAEQVSVMDIGPTVLELTGASESGMGGGMSLAHVRRRPGPPTGVSVERPLVILPNPHGEAEERGLRLGTWKLFQREGSEPVLIDLKDNPRELLTRPHMNVAHCNYMADLLARIVHDWGEAPRAQEIDEAAEEALRALGYVR